MRLVNSTSMKKLIAAIFFVFVSSSLFAVEEYISLIYKQIDNVFTDRNSDGLDTILKDNINDRYYYLIENYAQKKIRRLILLNDYDFAKETTLIVIDNNLDNTDAVEMYSLIIESYEIQKEAERKRAIAEQEEEERIERQMEKARGATEKTYVGASTADGKNVYLSSEKDMNFTRYEWKGQIGLVNLGILNKYNATQYGISLAGSYEYAFVNYTVAGDLFAGINLLKLNPRTDLTLAIPFELAGRVSFTQISRKLFVRAGIMDYITSNPNPTHFFSPILGIMMDKINLGIASASFGIDYYAGHLFNEGQIFAGGVNASIEVPFTELDKTKWYMSLGIKDKFIMTTDGTDNRLHVIFAVGGKNVVR